MKIFTEAYIDLDKKRRVNVSMEFDIDEAPDSAILADMSKAVATGAQQAFDHAMGRIHPELSVEPPPTTFAEKKTPPIGVTE